MQNTFISDDRGGVEVENLTLIGIYVDILGLIITTISIIVSIIGLFVGRPGRHGEDWIKRWLIRVLLLGLGAIATFIIFIAFRDMVPIEITIDYNDASAKVEVLDAPELFAKVYYVIGDTDEVCYEQAFYVYENTSVTIYAKALWFFKVSSISQDIDMLPVYEMAEDPRGIVLLEITSPKDTLKLESALSIQENGYLNFAQEDVAAGGIGGAKFIVPGIDGKKNESYYNQAEHRFKLNEVLQIDNAAVDNTPENPPPTPAPAAPNFGESLDPMTNQIVALSDFPVGGYLTIRVPLDHDRINRVDIVVNKSELVGLLSRNESIFIKTFYSEQILSVSMSTGAGAGCRLDQGLLLELYGPDHLMGSYATLEDGTVIYKSVAREQDPSPPTGGMGPDGQNPTRDGQVQPQPALPPNSVPSAPPNGGPRGSFCSLIIPVVSFDGEVKVRIVDRISDKDDNSMYSDVSAVDFDAVAYASGHELMVGYDAERTIFRPERAITYDTIATVLYRLAGSPETPNSKDASESGKSVYWAWKDAEIIKGNRRESFPSGVELNQKQCLRILWRFIYGKSSDDSVSDDEIKTWAVMNGIINEDAINPYGTVSRIQLARIIRNYCIADAVWKKAI